MTIGTEIESIRALVMAEKYLPPLDEENDYTVKHAMKDTKLSETGARDYMRKLCDSGAMRVVMKRDKNGSPIQTFVMA